MKQEFFMRYILCVLLVWGLMGCGDGEKLASVEGHSVTSAEFDAYLKWKRIDTQDDQRKRALLKKYMEREALAAAIEKSQVLDLDVIQAEVNDLRKEILISRYFDRFIKEQLSDEALRKYYETHADEYAENKVHVAHILIRTHPMMSDDQRKAMLRRALEIRDKVKGGQSFAELAKASSQDKATAHKGGDLGWIKKGAMGQAFSDVAFGLETGKVSDPVLTSFGYHLITVLEAPRVVNRPFESVVGSIRNKIKREARSKEVERLLGSVETKL